MKDVVPKLAKSIFRVFQLHFLLVYEILLKKCLPRTLLNGLRGIWNYILQLLMDEFKFGNDTDAL
jgi:hypothetical protein